ncbi:MAG: immunity protein Imm33 domain-containing protein [Planctomycetales bacterium]|jgi:hypothetical protein
MTRIEIHELGEWGHAPIRFDVDESSIPDVDVMWLRSTLVDSVKNACKYLDGETLQFGCMMTVLQMEDGILTLCEPKWGTLPIEWAPSVTRTLHYMRIQQDTAESVGLGNLVAFPNICQSVLVADDLLEKGDGPLLLARNHPEGNDSGWFFGNLNSTVDYTNPENLTRRSLYDLMVRFPESIMYLAMPEESQIEAGEGHVELFHADTQLEVRSDSFLAARLSAGV